MKISLVDFPNRQVRNEQALEKVKKHLGLFPSISLLYAASVLEKEGVEVQYIDYLAQGFNRAKLFDALKKFRPDIVGCTIYTNPFHNITSWLEAIKESLGVKIMVGGIHTTIFPKDTIRYAPMIDYAIVGEAEVVLPKFISALSKKEPLNRVPGLCYRSQDGSIQFTGFPDKLSNLDDAPFPARHLINNENYFSFISQKKNYTVFNSSRGCPFKCIFCEAGGVVWRARSPKNVVDEFQECLVKFGIREIDIFDSSFTISKKRVLDICSEINNRKLNKEIIWNVRSRVDTIDEEMLYALKSAGCYRIFYGIESGNPRILKTLRKYDDVKKIEQIIKISRKIGISTFGYFIMGNPGETKETAMDTMRLSKRSCLDFAMFAKLMAYPHTELYEKFYLPETKEDFWAKFIEDPMYDEKKFIGRPWTTLTDEEIDRLATVAFKKFYFRPMQIFRLLKTVKSFDQIKRYLFATIDMALLK